MELTGRRESILRTIVSEYVATGTPVASKTISLTDVRVSPATIRNDVTSLEEDGFVTRPHASAGAVPTDRAYRFFVESIGRDTQLPMADQLLIAGVCHDAADELDKRLRLIATLLAHFVHNAALVTQPKATRATLRNLHIVSLQETLALLILVLCEPAVVRQRTISLPAPMTQDELTEVSNRLGARLAGQTVDEVTAEAEHAGSEREMLRQIVDMMRAEERPELGRAYLEGLHLVLSQPEFAKSPRTLTLLRVMEREDWLETALGHDALEEGVRVIIGQENREEALQDLSLVIGNYGMSGRSRGVIGVVGPKRMDYSRAISSVNYLATLLSESLGEHARQEGSER
jgi:heat-inducible transcriptional repressor